jgi:aspartate ammonia-lyase
MNVNEVLCQPGAADPRRPLGDYETLSPLDDINLHQSTNDTYPTALRVAAIAAARALEPAMSRCRGVPARKRRSPTS